MSRRVPPNKASIFKEAVVEKLTEVLQFPQQRNRMEAAVKRLNEAVDKATKTGTPATIVARKR